MTERRREEHDASMGKEKPVDGSADRNISGRVVAPGLIGVAMVAIAQWFGTSTLPGELCEYGASTIAAALSYVASPMRIMLDHKVSQYLKDIEPRDERAKFRKFIKELEKEKKKVSPEQKRVLQERIDTMRQVYLDHRFAELTKPFRDTLEATPEVRRADSGQV